MRTALTIFFFLVMLPAPDAQQPFVRDLWLNELNAPVKVNAIAQDESGYHWVATDAGLYRFNGRTFSLLEDSIRSPVTALAVVRGKVYAGYGDGTIGVVINNKIEKVSISNARPSSAITSIFYNGGDVFWVCTEEQGLFAVVNNVGINCSKANGLSDNFIYSVSVMPGKRLLVGSDKGLNEISMAGGKLKVENYTTQQGLPDNIVRVLKPVSGTTFYWCGTQQGGLAFFCNKSRAVINPVLSEPWKWGQVNDILPMGGERAWVATEDGYLLEVFRRDSNRLDIKPVYLEGKKIKKLMLGRSGIIWAATNTGLTIISAEYMRYIRLPPDNYKLDDILAMACDKKNMLWYAAGKKLYKLSLDTDNAKPVFVLELPANITCLYADKENRLWMGTFGKGMWYKDADGLVTAVKDIPPLINESILDITGTNDRLWVAGLNGVEEIFYPGTYTGKMDLIRRHNKHSGIGSDYIYQLYTDRKERIWMATDGAGVCMYEDGRYTRWDTLDMKNSVVYSVTEDAYGNIWAAMLSKGLGMYDGKKWQSMQAMGVQDPNISTVAANATGQVIVVNDKGIDVWYAQSGLFRNYPHKSFGIDSTSSVLKLYAKDVDENVYIPYEDGLIVFRNIDPAYDIRPLVSITSVSVFFKPVPFGTNGFEHNENHVSFRFEGINFANPDKLHYRYKLEGYNDSWVVTNDEAVTFPQLPDGHYKLKVQASLNNVFNKAGEAEYLFDIEKPVWKEAWFIILCALTLFGIGFTFIRIREQNLHKLSSLQRERMMFEYEHLKSQVNPHFLFNSLNTLTSLIDEDPDAAMNYTARLSDLYRNMLSFRNKDLILLSEEWEILDNYIFIQKSRFGNALRVHVNVPEELMYTKRIVPLALQLLVENAIKHNIASASRPLNITIEASEETITVSNALQPKISKEKGAGLGLVNIKKRYTLLSKKQITAGISNNQYIVTLPLL